MSQYTVSETRTDVFLFELSRKMALDECSLTDTTIANKDEFELGQVLGSLRIGR